MKAVFVAGALAASVASFSSAGDAPGTLLVLEVPGTPRPGLVPEAMRHVMSGLAVMMQPHLPLTRRQHEMIATVVSAKNSCFY